MFESAVPGRLENDGVEDQVVGEGSDCVDAIRLSEAGVSLFVKFEGPGAAVCCTPE